MNLLYHWKGDTYRADLEVGMDFHLNQSNKLLHGIEPGESLWAFTRATNGGYSLAAELVISAKTLNPKGFRYGPYRVWGDPVTSRYFQVEGQPDISDLIRRIGLAAKSKLLGSAFQGPSAIRRLSHSQHQQLQRHAMDLPLEPRVKLVPHEETLEALLLAVEPEALHRLLHGQPNGLAPVRSRFLAQSAPALDQQIIKNLRDLYGGECQICRWAPTRDYRTELCEAHHVRWLNRGGVVDKSNVVLVCPNHHRAIHACNAPFDYVHRGFVFPNHIEILKRDLHEILPS
jgi:hypothetical protein